MRFIQLKDTGSTNDDVRALAEQGEGGPLWIRAQTQSKGRGRRGRGWTSQQGNLFASGLFPLPETPLAGAQLGFAAALSIADTVRCYAPDANISLKWPNDVLVDGAKISGILLETGTSHGAQWVIVGIGLNLLSNPTDTPYPVTHLLEHISKDDLETPEPIFTGPDAVLAVLASKFEHWRGLHRDEGFAPLRTAWMLQAHGLGQRAHIRLPDREFNARLIGLGENGELQAEHDNGTVESVYAGDVYPSRLDNQDS